MSHEVPNLPNEMWERIALSGSLRNTRWLFDYGTVRILSATVIQRAWRRVVMRMRTGFKHDARVLIYTKEYKRYGVVQYIGEGTFRIRVFSPNTHYIYSGALGRLRCVILS